MPYNREKYLIKKEKELNRKLKEVYEESLEIVESRILRYKISDKKNFGKKRLSLIRKERLKKQKELKKTINEELKALEKKEVSLLQKAQNEIYKEVYYRNGFSIGESLSTAKTWSNYGHIKLNDKAIRTALTDKVASKAALKIPNISKSHIKNLQGKIRKQVAKSIVTGLSEKELTKIIGDLDSAYKTVYANAQATARTEVFRAQSFAYTDSIEAAESVGVEGQSFWNSVLDARTRKDHRKMNGQGKKIKGKNKGYFVLPDGQRARYPRDVNLTAEQSVNCRCLEEFQPFGIQPTESFTRFDGETTEYLNRKDLAGDKRYKKWLKGLK